MTKVTDKLAEIRELSKKKLQISGPTEITGEAHVQGSKNTANKLVAVTVALPGVYHIKNFPFILDPLELLNLVELLGGSVDFGPENTVIIDTTTLENAAISYEMTKSTTGVCMHRRMITTNKVSCKHKKSKTYC